MTVYCGYCGQRGHNRLGCPQRKREARENPDGYIARQIKREEDIRKRAVASRTCSYCNRPGHNRRGCPTLKSDIALIRKRQNTFINDFIEATNEVGLGPGALVRIAHGRDGDPWSKQVLAMVTEFNWDQIDFINQDKSGHYNQTSRRVAKARVVSAKGWDPSDDSYWNQPPQHGAVVSLTANSVAQMIPELINISENHSSADPVQLIGPCKSTNNVRPSHIGAITDLVNSTFNLNPANNAKDWEKCRVSPHDELWKTINPEQYEQQHRDPKGE